MPSVERNLDYWTNYSWSEAGDEWSVGWGGTELMWAWTLLPRVASFLPAEHILEIAPGYGRVTQYLVHAAKRLTLVDIADRCIEACRERFAEHDHIGYHVNDGRSLDMVEDASIDLAFSWDSLIHVEEDVIETYLTQLARKLAPGGVGMLHHSNLGAYRDRRTGQLTIDNKHWRAPSVSAEKVRRLGRAVGLRSTVQELIPWGGPEFIDCISVFRSEAGTVSRWLPTKVIKNERFFIQAQQKPAAEIRAFVRQFRR